MQADPVIFNPIGMLGNVGVAMFLYEGQAVITNMRAEAKNKEQYETVLKLALGTAIVLFIAFALLCYLTYVD